MSRAIPNTMSRQPGKKKPGTRCSVRPAKGNRIWTIYLASRQDGINSELISTRSLTCSH